MAQSILVQPLKHRPTPLQDVATYGNSYSGSITAASFIGALTGNASTASKWATARTITLGTDLTGSVSIDGHANVTLNASVVNNSHLHTIANITGLSDALADKLDIDANAVSATKLDNIGTTFGGTYPMVINASGVIYSHTNVTYNGSAGILTAPTFNGALTGNSSTASKWATSRKIVLSGDVSGTSPNWDGSGDLAFADTVVADNSHNHLWANVTSRPSITYTLSGDVSGTVTSTLGNAVSITNTVVANDSHTHDGRYYTETECNSKFLLNTTDTLVGTLTATTFVGNLTGTASKVTVLNHTSNDIDYPMVWHNNASLLYETVSKLTFNPAHGDIKITGAIKSQEFTMRDTSNASKATMVYNETSESIDFNFI